MRSLLFGAKQSAPRLSSFCPSVLAAGRTTGCRGGQGLRAASAASQPPDTQSWHEQENLWLFPVLLSKAVCETGALSPGSFVDTKVKKYLKTIVVIVKE